MNIEKEFDEVLRILDGVLPTEREMVIYRILTQQAMEQKVTTLDKNNKSVGEFILLIYGKPILGIVEEEDRCTIKIKYLWYLYTLCAGCEAITFEAFKEGLREHVDT